MTADAWEWDPLLYSGSAAYYPRGRLAYPESLAEALAVELGLDGTGRLLDVGCGPGSLTLPLAGLVEQAVGLDADQGMIDEAGRLAAAAGIANTRWLRMRAEDLPAGLGTFRLVTFAQSFHWMDRSQVAAAVRGMLDANGACAHVHATTHQGIEGDTALPHPRPPHAAIAELVREYLGPVRRAGRSVLPRGTVSGESEIYRAAGFTGPRRIEIPGQVVTRLTDEIVAATFSLSSSTPHLFGDRRTEFEADLRRILLDTSPSGLFSEQMREIAVDIWRP
ncbi:class I SAM-dependent methyltransferase [Actinocrispum wychmicini]|uniref:Methyltransferase family protein n=1 Tax=Actinocrispum wychmicini TaxID=1213861 RepID=A0A4R2JRS4_9PSEU|nr:class I SAM-dependent methyltransferase [Actinocrispum wychmicini]TCO62961.1 methyltransferase family protein [Actinocrispum wychmicini]